MYASSAALSGLSGTSQSRRSRGRDSPDPQATRHPLSRPQVELFAGSQEVVTLAVMVLAVVDADDALADDLDAISLDDDRVGLVEPQAEQLGLLVDDLDQVILAATRRAGAGRSPRRADSRTLPRSPWPS